MKKFLKEIPIFLIFILVLSAILNFLFLSKEGYSNLYYAATVKSMLTSFKNFFFASFDSAGFVTVDKPPLGLWIQALFVLLFGFSGVSLILPQAISGVLSVLFIYFLVKDIFDNRAGLISAFILAITPIFVALSRNNTMDMQVVFITILSSWTFFKSIQKKSFKYLVLTFILIGLGFNIKMLLGFTALPAIGLVWLLSQHVSFKKRFIQILAGSVVLVIISLSGIIIVDLYPKEKRPYIGSTENNSAFNLAFSYNGLLRIVSPFRDKKNKPISPSVKSFYFFAPGGPPAEINESGKPGLLRLFNKELAGQISWFFPIIFVGLFFYLVKMKKGNRLGSDIKKLSILYWFLWLAPYLLYLSFTTGIFHRHYIVSLAPPIAALCGIFFILLWDSYKSSEKLGLMFPISVFLVGFLHFYIIRQYDRIPKYVSLLILIVSFVISIFLILNKIPVKLISRLPNIFLFIPILIVFSVVPFCWSCTPIIYGGNFALPYASPELYKDPTKGRRFISRDSAFVPDIKIMYDFLIENKTTEEFLAGAPSAYAYCVLLILYNENRNNPVMAVGGFTGKDRVLSLDEFKRYISEGKIRYFFIPSILGSPDEKGNAQLYHWIEKHGKKVDKSLWYTKYIPHFIPSQLDLYDLKQ